jgi:hypothetical protein
VRALRIISSTLAPAAWGSLLGLVFACQPSPPAAPPAGSGAPVPPPRPSITGCVESPELKRYVLALDAHRREARQAALAALGATSEVRAGTFASTGSAAELESELESGGKRFVVAAQVATERAPEATLARVGAVSYRIDERPKGHATPVLVCGVRRCAAPANTPSPPPARAVLIELSPAERWGGTLALEYDFWWADVRYDRAEACPPGAGAREPASGR